MLIVVSSSTMLTHGKGSYDRSNYVHYVYLYKDVVKYICIEAVGSYTPKILFNLTLHTAY